LQSEAKSSCEEEAKHAGDAVECVSGGLSGLCWGCVRSNAKHLLLGFAVCMLLVLIVAGFLRTMFIKLGLRFIMLSPYFRPSGEFILC
jgi:hypothetical protein